MLACLRTLSTVMFASLVRISYDTKIIFSEIYASFVIFIYRSHPEPLCRKGRKDMFKKCLAILFSNFDINTHLFSWFSCRIFISLFSSVVCYLQPTRATKNCVRFSLDRRFMEVDMDSSLDQNHRFLTCTFENVYKINEDFLAVSNDGQKSHQDVFPSRRSRVGTIWSYIYICIVINYKSVFSLDQNDCSPSRLQHTMFLFLPFFE